MANGRVPRTVPKIIAVSAAVAACASIQALAQPAANGAAGNDQSGAAASAVNGDQLAEVVVTAEKRTENLQTLPQTVTAVTGTEMLQEGVKDITDLSRVAPEVFVNNGQLNNIGIRGIKTNSFGPTLDSANAVYVDGNYNARFTSLNGLFFDMQRIEVLDGPQGTLYGRNSAGGAINVITNKPTQTFGGYGWVEWGTFNDLSLNGALNLPISDTLAARFAVMRNSHSGFMTDSGQDDEDLQGARAELLWKPTANDSLLLTAQESSIGGKGPGASTITRVFTNPTLVNDQTTGLPALTCGRGDTCTPIGTIPINVTDSPLHNKVLVGDANLNFVNTHNDEFALQYDHTFGSFATLTIQASRMSNTSNNESGFVSGLEQNPLLATAGLFGEIGGSNNFGASDLVKDQWDSQEVRLTSISTKPLQWVVGLYRYHEIGSGANPQFTTTATATGGLVFPTGAPVDAQDIPNLLNNDNARAVFTQATWTPSFSDALHVTGGVRYNDEGKHGIVTIPGILGIQAFGPTGIFNDAQTWTATTYKVNVAYDITPSNMVYVDRSTGFQSGGIGYGSKPLYQPTHIWAWEIGSKNRFFDNALQVNLSAWYYQYSNQTANINDVLPFPFTPTHTLTFITVANAGTSIDRGQSLDLEWNLTHDDQLGVNVQHVNAVYTSFNLTQRYLSQAATFAPPGVSAAQEFLLLYPGYSNTGNQAVPSFNYNGTKVGNTPDWTIYTTLQHTFRWADRQFTVQAVNRYVGSQINGNQEQPNMPPYNGFWTLPAYDTWDFTLSYAPEDGKYAISLWTRNAFNKTYATAVGYVNGGQSAVAPANSLYAYETENFGPPRMYGLQIQANF